MAEPIPLAAPDGTVYAWACGECGRIGDGGSPDADTRDQYVAWAAGSSRHDAERCCRRCLVCRCTPDDGETLCRAHLRAGRRAFEVLAAIGMAVAVREYADVCARIATLGGGRTGARGERQVGIVAALCGVSPETVRGWR